MRIIFTRSICLLALKLMFFCSAFGQANPSDFAKMSDFLPPSPNAAALGKFGGISISQNTGLPNISIPLVSFSSHQLSFAASLQYSSGGIKVDEIASRAGMGWVLEAGGVVNRTVMGVADELANNRTLIANPNPSSWQFHEIIKTIAVSPPTSGYDGQADIFSFNFAGNSGRFVLDEQMNPVLLPLSNLKIETNFFNTVWNIKITTPDGIQYFFGGINATEESKKEADLTSCGKNYDQYTPTAWYLKTVQHPNGDVLTFNYIGHDFVYHSNKSQTQYAVPILSGCSPSSCPTLQFIDCDNYLAVKSKILTEVVSSSQGKVRFSYTTRQDCADKLVSKIELVDKVSNRIIDTYDLIYYYFGSNQIPYLSRVNQRSTTILKGKEYQLYYYSPSSRPNRVPYSFAQDHWGYYNGKTANNTLIQRPADVPTQQKFPFATADRAPVFASTVMGMLSSIRYPTGGQDSITYEANVYGTNTVTGGLRVKTVITDDHPGDAVNKPIVKRYFYSPISNLSVSSALTTTIPIYLKIFKSRNWCNPGYSYCEYVSLHSNSLNNLFDFSSSPVSYSSVIESHGANFENGGTEYKFLAGADAKGVILLNEEIMNAPYSNFGFMNGKLIEKNEFRVDAGFTNLKYLHKTINTYKIDTTKSKIRINWIANRKYEQQGAITSPPAAPGTWELEAIDVMRYDMMSYWIYLESTAEIENDQNGLNSKTTTTNFYYDDPDNLMLSRTQKTDSKGNLVKTAHTYPHDYIGTPVYDAMISRHIIAPIIQFKTLENTNPVATSITETNFSLTPTYNLAMPANVEKTLTGSEFVEGTFDKYDDKGNLLQYTGKDGIKVSYVWGYGGRYVIAKVIGADYTAVSASVNVPSLQTITDDGALRTALNAIRSISNTLVTTYTHRPLIGISSETDPNGRSTFYEYDELGRLILVRDLNGKVMKKLCYNYHGQVEYCNLFYNEQKSQVFTKVCDAGYAGTPITYLVPAQKYISSISLADANAMAQAEIDANGQAYANNNGTCQIICTTSNCVGVNKKCINNICETGAKIYTSSTQIGPHLYECVYHYEWSDGSWSVNYTEQSPTPCFLVE
jgi:YD repeat-containing protein